MKVLDYKGLTRLTSNIKSYIASLLAPVDDRTTYYCEGMWYVLKNAFYAEGQHDNITFHPGNKTLTASSTGAQKKFYDRMMKGFPAVLLIDTSYITTVGNTEQSIRNPYFLRQGMMSGAYEYTATYYPAISDFGGQQGNKLIVKVDKRAKTVTTSVQTTDNLHDYITHPDYTAQLPVHWTAQSINSAGTVSPLGSVALGEDSTGDALELFNTLKKVYPHCMTASYQISDTRTITIPLYINTINATGNPTYESGVITTTAGNKIKAQITVTNAGNPAATTIRGILKTVSAT